MDLVNSVVDRGKGWPSRVHCRSRRNSLLLELQSSFALTYLFITHDLAMAAHLGDEIAVMDRGRVVEQGVPEKILHTPEQEATRRLVAAIPGSSVTPRLPRAS